MSRETLQVMGNGPACRFLTMSISPLTVSTPTSGPRRKRPTAGQRSCGTDRIIGVVMGSRNDYEVMRAAVDVLREFGVPYEVRVVSAHRTPDLMFSYADAAVGRGLRVIVAGAGGAAHLPGMIAARTVVPVLGVPIAATTLQGIDALLSIVQMPKGVPVATLAIGSPGATNAGLLAVQILGITDPELQAKLVAWRATRRDEVLSEAIDHEVLT